MPGSDRGRERIGPSKEGELAANDGPVDGPSMAASGVSRQLAGLRVEKQKKVVLLGNAGCYRKTNSIYRRSRSCTFVHTDGAAGFRHAR